MAGQLIRRGERTWLVRIYLGRDGAGKRKYLNKTVQGNKKHAEQTLTKLLRERDVGTLVEPSETTLDAYLERWLEGVARMRVRENTYEDYRFLMRRYVRPVLGNRRLDQLKTLEVQQLYSDMSASGLSPRTVRYTHTVLRNALAQAVTWGMLARNPADLAVLPRKQRQEMQALTPEEARRFLSAAKEDPCHAVFNLLLDTGLRPSEALGLKWDDMDLSGRSLAVRRTLTRGTRGWRFEEPKTLQSRRSVPFTDGLLSVLLVHKEAQPTNALRLVFTGETGEPLIANNLAKRNLNRILRQAGLSERFRLYDLRHTCATLMLIAGVHPKVVSERLGHASVKITLDTYSHVLPTIQREATEKLGNLLYENDDEARVYN